MLPEYMSVTEAAKYLGVVQPTVRNWIKTGRLPAVRFGPRLLRIRTADIEALFSPVHTTDGAVKS